MAPTPPRRRARPPLCCDGGDPDSSGVVLVADDDADFAATVEHWLTPEWRVETAEGGPEALDAYGPHVDAVLLDRRMPSLSGDEVLSKIRERDGDARVAMLTAVEPDWDIVSLDFDMYVQKPLKREELHEAVEELFERASYAQEVRALYTLGSKIGLLRSRYPASELAEDRRYQRLEAEFERIHRRANERVADLDDERFRELLQVVEEPGRSRS